MALLGSLKSLFHRDEDPERAARRQEKRIKSALMNQHLSRVDTHGDVGGFSGSHAAAGERPQKGDSGHH